MEKTTSITRRLTVSVLALELLAGIILIGAVTIHERHVQFETFDANLRATSNALLGAVQEGEGSDGSVILDLHNLDIPKRSTFRVTDEHGRVLGAGGPDPPVYLAPGEFKDVPIDGHTYRFFSMSGDRLVDPGYTRGVRHHITVVCGQPEGRVWHEIIEAIRFFAIATIALLGITAVFLSWLIRNSLLPIRELANEADKINSNNWQFNSPPSAKEFTELSPLASAIERTITRLHRAFEQQRQMTNDAAHELKTDIAIIKSSFQVIAMKQRSVGEYEKGIAIGVRDIGRLEQTVQKMLTLARLDQGQPSEFHSCRIDDVLLDTLSQSSAFAEVKNISIKTKLEAGESVPIGRDDAVLLGSNILINAIQHSAPRSELQIVSAKVGHTVKITVRDHGRGIHEDDRPFLFDPFYRGDPSRSRKSGGTGLGLSICKAICDRANGTIEIENHADGGAIVTITLPVATRSSDPEDPSEN
ncbi:signal transduction histidine kinase [Edaphobacter modestus]|uniref:histidine kinase n=1 Tax=Edaphobacter modestus TaxID=388466 RepID=A0A4Q7YRJ0_9BACT|nr:signal transduction histidine kinase [Edaphobacter modestus]